MKRFNMKACKHCHKLYDEFTQQSFCPHKEFPKMCKIHHRYNCGSFECNRADIKEIKDRKIKEG